MAIDARNTDKLLDSLKVEMNKQLLEAAEPEIQLALSKVESAMRKRAASMFIALLDKNMSLERMGTDLHITIRHVYAAPKTG